jgi:hypothetical protein
LSYNNYIKLTGKIGAMKINYKDIEKALCEMSPRSVLFGLVKAEMKRRGHWKNLKRGKPNPDKLNKK